MKIQYLLRLDDACETMDAEKWGRIEKILHSRNIKPLIAVIPNNQDPELKNSFGNKEFWSHLKELERIGWEICMHGNTHIYHTRSGGLNPVHNRSEFAGLSLETQREEIRKGFLEFSKNNILPRIFSAPSHTFDNNTLLALKKETPIRIISDTISFNPYLKNDFCFIPNQFSRVRNIWLPGLFTFSYHPGTMKDSDFQYLEKFLDLHGRRFLCFSDLNLNGLRKRRLADYIYSYIYFLFRKTFRREKLTATL